jgi:hypothetical protein
MTAAISRARTAFLWVGVIIPLAMIAVSALVVAIWLPHLPEPAAIHWSSDGVDGLAPGWTHLAVLCGVGGGMIIAFSLLVWFAHRPPRARGADAARPQWSVTARFLGAVNLGLAGLMSVVALAAVGPQRGLTDAMDAPNVGGPAAIGGFGLLIVLTAVGWFLQPKVDARAADDAASAAPLPTSASERVIWIGSATISRGGKGVLGGLVLLVCVIAIVVIASGRAGFWPAAILIATAVVVAVAFIVTLVFRVRIGPNGLSVRSLVGWPTIDIPAAEVTAVRAVTVNPFAEFGGWGLRYGLDGRYGVVLRAGEAIEVTRTDGRRFVVTIDDAETAASVLATAARVEG